MTVGAALLVYAVALGTLGPVLLRPDDWLTRAPRLGATLLLAASWSAVTAFFLAGLTIALPGTALSSGLSDLLGACIVRLRTAYTTPGGAAVAGAGLTLSGTIALRTAWALCRGWRIRRRELLRHRTLIALCGRVASTSEPVLLEQPHPAVYCLAGRRRTVVVTRGALDLLSRPELDAVLAHEQAHARSHHHRALAAASVVGAVLPELPLVRAVGSGVRGLLEMHADDVAARRHEPETLATALVTLATSARPVSPAALAGADTEAVARVRRLLGPPRSLAPRARCTVRLGTAGLAVVPLLLALAPAVVAANQPPVRQPAAHAGATRP